MTTKKANFIANCFKEIAKKAKIQWIVVDYEASKYGNLKFKILKTE